MDVFKFVGIDRLLLWFRDKIASLRTVGWLSFLVGHSVGRRHRDIGAVMLHLKYAYGVGVEIETAEVSGVAGGFIRGLAGIGLSGSRGASLVGCPRSSTVEVDKWIHPDWGIGWFWDAFLTVGMNF